MSGHSPIDALRQLAPVSDVEAVAIFGTAGCEELLAGVTREALGRPARTVARRRRPLVLALAVVVAAATAAGAWAVLHGSPAQETTTVQCLVGRSDAIIPSTSGDPAHDCVADYKREFGTTPPPLLAYDNGHGGVTVLLRSETPPAGFKRLVSGQDADLIQLQDSLDDYVNGLNSSCLGRAAATSLAESKLAQFGFTGWAVIMRSQGPSSTNLPTPKAKPGAPKAAPSESTTGTRTCVAGDIVDPSTQSVTLIPTSVATGTPTAFEQLAAKLRPLTQSCESLPAAVESVRADANSLGLSESGRAYDLNAVTDNSVRCASIYETVGGTIFLTVRGPRG